jgi:hypothetical protein
MPSRQAKLQQDTYFRVMRILQENPDLTQRELAEKAAITHQFLQRKMAEYEDDGGKLALTLLG